MLSEAPSPIGPAACRILSPNLRTVRSFPPVPVAACPLKPPHCAEPPALTCGRVSSRSSALCGAKPFFSHKPLGRSALPS